MKRKADEKQRGGSVRGTQSNIADLEGGGGATTRESGGLWKLRQGDVFSPQVCRRIMVLEHLDFSSVRHMSDF